MRNDLVLVVRYRLIAIGPIKLLQPMTKVLHVSLYPTDVKRSLISFMSVLESMQLVFASVNVNWSFNKVWEISSCF